MELSKASGIRQLSGRFPNQTRRIRGTLYVTVVFCLISIPCKVYADILNVRFSKWIDENNIVVDEQNGFRQNRSCLEHIYVLYTVINKRKQQKQSTYVCFVDAKKAFDTVQRDCLWYKLTSLGITGKILKAVQSLYAEVQCVVKVNDYLTPFIYVTQGVKQGHYFLFI